jgi:hypothetical protein
MAQTGYTPISIYYSTTASAAPTAGSLVAGELAINTNDGVLYYKDSSGVVQKLATKGGVGTSSTTQVLYNNAGLIAGSSNMTFNGTTLTTANDASISGLTVGKGGGAVGSNTGVGLVVLASNTSGSFLTAMGTNALSSNTSGGDNSAFGGQALKLNTTGSLNSGFGTNALYTNTTGGYNTALGHSSLFNNTTASNNTAVGYQAGYSNTTGGSNSVAVGYQALYGATNGYNVGIGSLTLTGSGNGYYNVAVGYQAGQANTTGYTNTFIGMAAGVANTTANQNTFIGQNAGASTTTGGANTYVGLGAGQNNTTGTINTLIGIGSGYTLTTGSKNTILGGYNGNQGGLDIRTSSNYIVLSDGDGNPRGIFDGSGNYLVGTTTASSTYGKLTVSGGISISEDSSAKFQIGRYSAGVPNSYIKMSPNSQSLRFTNPADTVDLMTLDSSGNLLVGTTSAGVTNTKSVVADLGGAGYLIVNHTGTATGSAYQYFGYNGGAIGSITQTGTTAVLYNTTSDYRLKNDVAPIQNALATIEALNPVSFTWIDGRKDDGFLAHELQEVIPNCVTGEKDAINEDGTPKYQQMDNSGVIPFLVKAIQELKAEVDSLKQQLGK